MSSKRRLKTAFTEIEEEFLIDYVRRNKILFPSSQGVKNKRIKDAKWKILASNIGRSVADCKIKWKSLRDYYKKIKKHSDGLNVGPKAFNLLERLSFLPLAPATTSLITSSTEITQINESLKGIASLRGSGTSTSFDSEASPATPHVLHSSKNKRKLSHFHDSSEIDHLAQHKRFEAMQEEQIYESVVTDSDLFRKFFSSMADVALQLPRNQQIQLMRIISDAMCSLQDEALQEKNARGTNVEPPKGIQFDIKW